MSGRRKLGTRFPYRHRRDDPGHLAGAGDGVEEVAADLIDDALERRATDAVLADELLGREEAAQQHRHPAHALGHSLFGDRLAADAQLGDQRVDAVEHPGGLEVRGAGGRRRRCSSGAVQLGGGLDDAPDVDRVHDGGLDLFAAVQPDDDVSAVVQQLAEVRLAARGPGAERHRGDLGEHAGGHVIAEVDLGVDEQVVDAQLGRLAADGRQLLELELDRVHAVLAVQELHHEVVGVAHGEVVVDLAVLHGLDQAALQVPGLAGVPDPEAVGEHEIERRRHGHVVQLAVQYGVRHDRLDRRHRVQHDVVLDHERWVRVAVAVTVGRADDDAAEVREELGDWQKVADLDGRRLRLIERLGIGLPDQQRLAVRDGHLASTDGRHLEEALAGVVARDGGQAPPRDAAFRVYRRYVHVVVVPEVEELHVELIREALDPQVAGHLGVDPLAETDVAHVVALGDQHRGVPHHRADRRVDEADAAGHGVEEELVRAQALDERVLDEAARLGAVVVLCKVRQRAAVEAVGHALVLDRLRAEARGHLLEVDHLALAAGDDHVEHAVVADVGAAARELKRRLGAGHERGHDLLLDELGVVARARVLERARVHAAQHVERLGLGGGHEVALLGGGLGRYDEVRDAHREAGQHEPVADELLRRVEHRGDRLRAERVVGRVHEAERGLGEDALGQHAALDHAALDAHEVDVGVVARVVGVAVAADHSHVGGRRQHRRQHFATGPGAADRGPGVRRAAAGRAWRRQRRARRHAEQLVAAREVE